MNKIIANQQIDILNHQIDGRAVIKPGSFSKEDWEAYKENTLTIVTKRNELVIGEEVNGHEQKEKAKASY